jgi:hypothetical protein
MSWLDHELDRPLSHTHVALYRSSTLYFSGFCFCGSRALLQLAVNALHLATLLSPGRRGLDRSSYTPLGILP